MEILKTREFWWLYIMGFFSIFFGFFMASAYKNYGIELIFDDAFLSFAGAIAFATNGTSRLVLGSLLDCFNFKTIYGFVIIVQVSLVIFFRLLYVGLWIFCLNTSPSSWCMCALRSYLKGLILLCSRQPWVESTEQGISKFTHRSGKFAFSLLFSSFMLSTMTGALFNGFVLPLVGFANIFYTCGFFSLISLVMLYFYHPVNHAKHAVSKKFLHWFFI